MNKIFKTNIPESIKEESKITLDPNDPMATARIILSKSFSRDGIRTLHFHHSIYRLWDGNRYQAVDGDTIKAIIYKMLEKAVRSTQDGVTPFKPTAPKVKNIMDALGAVTNLDNRVNAPAWLDDRKGPNPINILALKNGLLDLSNRTLLKPTPYFWSHNSLDYEYSPTAAACGEWLKFLNSVWEDDPESIKTLQEIFGYLLTGDTRQQKIFFLVGPPRAGKGTIGRILSNLLGHNNVSSPTLNSMSSQFGVAPMIDKLVAIISEARFDSRLNQQITEKLLSISGEDRQTIDRKYLSPWEGHLVARLFMMSNELPQLTDASGALSSRFIILKMTKTFLGKEDQALTSRLLKELPSILNWAIDGRDRLMKRGYFLQPTSSNGTIQELEELTSPIGAFISDCCIVEPQHNEKIDVLFSEWKEWCFLQGIKQVGNKQIFSRNFHAALPEIKTVQLRDPNDGKRARYFFGIKLA
jgi:putative DNA primase/helicase